MTVQGKAHGPVLDLCQSHQLTVTVIHRELGCLRVENANIDTPSPAYPTQGVLGPPSPTSELKNTDFVGKACRPTDIPYGVKTWKE